MGTSIMLVELTNDSNIYKEPAKHDTFNETENIIEWISYIDCWKFGFKTYSVQIFERAFFYHNFLDLQKYIGSSYKKAEMYM